MLILQIKSNTGVALWPSELRCHSWTTYLKSAALFLIQLPVDGPGEAINWITVIHVRDQNEVPGFGLAQTWMVNPFRE